MQFFSITEVERLSGIKAHTLRVWESRYGMAIPQRKSSNHRYYSAENLRKILQVSWLYHRGYKISLIASLSPETMREMIEQEADQTIPPNLFVAELLVAGEQFDDYHFGRLLDMAFLRLGVQQTMLQVIYPFLEKIGINWMNTRIQPAHEHFSSQIIRHKIMSQIQELPYVPLGSGSAILLFTPEEEYHDIPILFLQYLLRKNKIPAVNMGASVSPEVLETYCRKRPVAQLHYHHITNLTDLDPQTYFQELMQRFPKSRIVASGPASAEILTQVSGRGLVLSSLQEYLDYSKSPFDHSSANWSRAMGKKTSSPRAF